MPVLNVRFPRALSGGSNPTIPGGGRPVLLEEIPIPATPSQEEVWSFTRFHVELPVQLEERELTRQVTEQFTLTTYTTEAERAAAEGGTRQLENLSIEPIDYNKQYEKVKNELQYIKISANNLQVKTTITTETSVVPLTVQLILQIIGSEGILWSSTFDVPIRYVGLGAPGSYQGAGYADEYADLTNPITVLSGQPLKLRLFVAVPTAVKTIVLFPVNTEGGVAVELPASMNLYYDPLPRSDYPLKRGGAK